jgi:sec-independent protein translocase protein TatA
MFGFHWLELLVLLPIIALILGPKRLPAVGAALGRAIRGFREGVSDLKEETGIDEMRRSLRKGLSELKDESGIAEVHRGLREDISDLKHLKDESGIAEVRRELSSLDKPRPPG